MLSSLVIVAYLFPSPVAIRLGRVRPVFKFRFHVGFDLGCESSTIQYQHGDGMRYLSGS